MSENEISKIVIDASIKIHRKLGPGLLERVYEECLFYELKKTNLKVERQVKLPIVYEDVILSYGYRIDLLIEDKLVVELKASEYLHSLYTAQTLTYMKLINAKLGLLINFNVPLLKDGIKRIINGKL
jgi:GxxExxY protein